MATNKKGKSPKDFDKKIAKKTDDSSLNVEKTTESPSEEDHVEEVVTEEVPVVEDPPPKQPTPEPVLEEESVLVQLIVESYEGETAKGLYEGEGEACFMGGHTYKGQFHEGMMHGHGKYTWVDGLVYEGDFSRNEVTGKGIYTWPDGSCYDGEVDKGKRRGFGIFKCKDENMRYTGEWFHGKRHGKGRIDYDRDGFSFYEGEWVNNVKHGWGTRQYPSGNLYQGMWYNNVRHGEGTMRWLDLDQMYAGQWEKGIQCGHGNHIWFLHRVAGSQYALRNLYDGKFLNGLRHGLGTFFYANGARYEGLWKNNMKDGQGKFIFKNGRIYEGVFEKDHIMEYPSFVVDGVKTPDLGQIRTRTPLPSEHSNDSRNTSGPSFQLEIDHLLQEFTEIDQEEEAKQVQFVMMCYMTKLRKVYTLYSQLGYEESPDNTYVMSYMQFWRFLKDCRLHHHEITLMEMDRVLAADKVNRDDLHNPCSKILFREFLNHLITLGYHIYGVDHEGTSPILCWCLSKIITEKVLKYSCSIKGYIYYEDRRAVNALVHVDQAYAVYKMFCSSRKHEPYEPTLSMRNFLFLLQDLKLINSDLTAAAIIDVLSCDDPSVADPEGSINMELEMTFLEFFEALVGCAQVYVTEAVVKDPTSPQPSVAIATDPSLASMTGTMYRETSQLKLEEGLDEAGHRSVTPGHVATSENGSPIPGAASDMTQKTVDGSVKPSEVANTTEGSMSEAAGLASHPPDSAKKSDITMTAEQKQSASCISTHSVMSEADQLLGQSQASLGGEQSEAQRDLQTEGEEEEYDDVDEESLDEATRQFNFWTHQVHIFFVRKFFPAAHTLSLLKEIIQQKNQTSKNSDSKSPSERPITSSTTKDEKPEQIQIIVGSATTQHEME